MIGERVSSERESVVRGSVIREGVSREITILNLYLIIAIAPPISIKSRFLNKPIVLKSSNSSRKNIKKI